MVAGSNTPKSGYPRTMVVVVLGMRMATRPDSIAAFQDTEVTLFLMTKRALGNNSALAAVQFAWTDSQHAMFR
eukprot:14280857-Alexandrium_andersonii.AAC.1